MTALSQISRNGSEKVSASALDLRKNQQTPGEFLCPITYEAMVDPVVAPDGQSYERKAIEKWLRDHNTSPVTREIFGQPVVLVPNYALRSAIQRWRVGEPSRRGDDLVESSTLKSAGLEHNTGLGGAPSPRSPEPCPQERCYVLPSAPPPSATLYGELHGHPDVRTWGKDASPPACPLPAEPALGAASTSARQRAAASDSRPTRLQTIPYLDESAGSTRRKLPRFCQESHPDSDPRDEQRDLRRRFDPETFFPRSGADCCFAGNLAGGAHVALSRHNSRIHLGDMRKNAQRIDARARAQGGAYTEQQKQERIHLAGQIASGETSLRWADKAAPVTRLVDGVFGAYKVTGSPQAVQFGIVGSVLCYGGFFLCLGFPITLGQPLSLMGASLKGAVRLAARAPANAARRRAEREMAQRLGQRSQTLMDPQKEQEILAQVVRDFAKVP